jgi:hypothetical protein
MAVTSLARRCFWIMRSRHPAFSLQFGRSGLMCPPLPINLEDRLCDVLSRWRFHLALPILTPRPDKK